MRYHSQNLTADYLDRKERAMFWAGRAWLYSNAKTYQPMFHWEWAFGRYARGFALKASFGYGDSNSGLCLHLCLPFICQVFLVFERLFTCEECETGIAIHNQAIWFYPLSFSDHSSREDPWWRRIHSWSFPWELNWYQTEILSHDLKTTVWKENEYCRLGGFDGFDQRQLVEESVSKDYPYTYVRKNGEVQNRTATVHATRTEWRARWWPLFRNRKISTSIHVKFNEEVGDGSGSWKGGCIGCGYDILPSETIEKCLRRMETKRTFKR